MCNGALLLHIKSSLISYKSNIMRHLLIVITLLGIISCHKNTTPSGPNNPPENPPQTITPPPMLKGFMMSRVENVDMSTINTVVNWGAKIIRVQINPVRFALAKNKDIWEALPDYIAVIKTCLNNAKSAGLKVVLDLHEPMILKDGKQTSAEYWNTSEFWDREDVKPSFIRFWKEVAEALKGAEYNEVVYGYDIYNEAVEKSTIPTRWRAMAPDIIAEIRKIDSDVWIVYEPGPWGDVAGYRNMEPLADKRVIYSIHFYTPQSTFTHVGLDFYGSATATRQEALAAINQPYPGTHKGKYWDKAALAAELKVIDDFQTKYKVPIYVGEFSVITWVPVASSTQWLKDVTDLFEERKWAWCYHAFREWQGWSLEQPEGIEAFWFRRDGTPPAATTETERAKVIKKALKTNGF